MTRLSTLLYDNLVDRAATVITVGTWSLDLPAENVRHPFLTKVARTGTSTAAEELIFDFGSAVTAEAVLIDAHTLTSGDSGIKIQGNAADAWGSPSFSENIVYEAGRILHYFASAQTFRYWRIAFTKASAGVTRDIGRVFIGPTLELNEELDPEDVDFSYKDPSDKSRALGSNVYTNQRPCYYQLKLSAPGMYMDVVQSVLTAYLSLRLGTPFYLNLYPDMSDEVYYVVFMDEPTYKTKGWDELASKFIAALKFSVEEFK